MVVSFYVFMSSRLDSWKEKKGKQEMFDDELSEHDPANAAWM